MNRIVSVDKSLLSGGAVTYFVVTEDGNGARTRIEVGEAEARRFQSMLRAQKGQSGPRILTETMPTS